MIHLYDDSSVDELNWPKTVDGNYAKRYLYPLIKKGVNFYIDNVKTKLFVLKLNDLVFPVTVNEEEYDNSYVASPYSQYVTCAIEELHVIKNPLLRKVLKWTLLLLGSFLKAGKINRTVIVNNWLLSTNLYPEITPQEIEKITRFLKARFPTHFIAWRSLNEKMHQERIAKMNQMGYSAIAGRLVYLFDTNDPFKKRDIKRDLQALQDPGTEVLPYHPSIITPEEMADFYYQLYLTKYSTSSPCLNNHYFSLAAENHLLGIKALKIDGITVGFLGYFQRNGWLTCPGLGYKLDANKKDNLYRKLAISIMLEAKKHHLQLHCSSGVGEFKKNRGAKPAVEYNLFYGEHLSFLRRGILKLLCLITEKIGVPLLKKYG